MPARKRPPTFADAYSAVANDLRQRIGDAHAAQAGPPASLETQPVTDRDRARAWQAAHPEATDEAMRTLAQQRYQQHRASGRSEDDAERMTAEDLTHYRYRARMPLYTLGIVSWKDQVKEAKRLARLAERGNDGDDGPPPPPEGGTTDGY